MRLCDSCSLQFAIMELVRPSPSPLPAYWTPATNCMTTSFMYRSQVSTSASSLSTNDSVVSTSPTPPRFLTNWRRNYSCAAARLSRNGRSDSSRGVSSAAAARSSHEAELSSSPWEEYLDSVSVDVMRAEARELNVPLLAPFTIATMKLERVENVAIRVTLRDGSVGWGEAPTLRPVTAEDQSLALAKASEACILLEAQSGSLTLRELLKRMSGILPGHGLASVRAGMEMAVVDAVARSLHLPLWRFFGGHGASVTTDITIPICPPEEAEELAVQYAARGFTTIKTKVGGRALSSDIGLLRAIRRGHPSCSLILDANCGYNADEALQVLRELHDIGLTPSLFEQPVERNDWTGLGHVSKVAKDLYGVPVAADESCRGIEDASRIVERGLAGVINLKLAKMGVLEALELVTLVRRGGLELMIGGMVETRLGMGFAGHLAAGLGCFRFIDLDTPLLLAEDPVIGGYKADGAVYHFSEAYGHGGTLK